MDYSSIRDSRDIATMPELNRSTLMDQIDYDLDNYKINESSMGTNSIDLSKHSIPKQMFSRAQSSLEPSEEIQPKFMGFLNENQKSKNFTERPRKESITMLKGSSSVSDMLMRQFSFRNSNHSSKCSKRSSQYNSNIHESSSHRSKYSRNTRRNVHLKESMTYQDQSRKEIVLIRPNRDGSNKFETKPVLSSEPSDNFSTVEYPPNFDGGN